MDKNACLADRKSARLTGKMAQQAKNSFFTLPQVRVAVKFFVAEIKRLS